MSGERTLIALLYCTIQKVKSEAVGPKTVVLIVLENNRVTETIGITGTIESPWTMGHKNNGDL